MKIAASAALKTQPKATKLPIVEFKAVVSPYSCFDAAGSSRLSLHREYPRRPKRSRSCLNVDVELLTAGSFVGAPTGAAEAGGGGAAGAAADMDVPGARPGGFAAPAEPAAIMHTPSSAMAALIVIDRGTTAS